MNNEIKAINIPNDVLIALGDLTNGALNYYKASKSVMFKHKTILDYITNLQEENERLKEIVENLTTMTVCGDRKQIKNTAQYKLDICKSKIDKAIEYVKSNEFIGKIRLNSENKQSINNLLDILQGSDKKSE